MFHSFCALCGVVCSQYSDASPTPAALPWTGEIRAVRFAHSDTDPILSGVGISGESEIRAAFNPLISYMDDFDALELHILRLTRDPTIYVFHDACWQLLLSRLIGAEGGDANSRALHVAKLLFHLLRCLPKNCHGAFRIQHDYGGASKFLWNYAYSRGAYERRLPDDWRFLLANPGYDATREISASLANLAETWRLTENHGPTDAGYPAIGGGYRGSGKDPFGRLPPEMLDLLFMELESTDLCNLRLASRAVASISSPNRLSQSFWESRFAYGFEMAFFFSGRPPPTSRRDIDWYGLYLVVNRCLAEGPLREGLRNRKRIWNCLSYFCASLQPVWRGNGTPCPITTTAPSSTRSSIPKDLSLGPIARSHAPNEYKTCHISFLTLSGNTHARLSVSFIRFNRGRYISGLRLRSDQGESMEAPLHESGIIIPESEEHVNFPLHEAIRVRVYTAKDGIVGLKFYFHGKKRLALGHSSVSRGGVAVADLSPRTLSHIRGLMVTFDGFKATAVQIVEGNIGTETAVTGTENAGQTAEQPPSILWKDSIPTKNDGDLIPAAYQVPNLDEMRAPVRLNMSFGGARGQNLELLNLVAAAVDGQTGLLKGFTFKYDDGTSASYGSIYSVSSDGLVRRCIDVLFAVRGRDGERITEIRVFKGEFNKREHIQGIQFITNMESKGMLARDSTRDDVLAKKPFITFVPPHGEVLTGLVTELTDFDGRPDFNGIFSSVGVATSHATGFS